MNDLKDIKEILNSLSKEELHSISSVLNWLNDYPSLYILDKKLSQLNREVFNLTDDIKWQ